MDYYEIERAEVGEPTDSSPPISGDLSADAEYGIHVGQRVDGANAFSGSIDEVWLLDRSLSEDEILTLAHDNAAPGESPRLHLPLDEFQEAGGDGVRTTPDLSGFDNQGVVVGSPTLVDGVLNDAIDLAPGDHVEVAYSDSIAVGDGPFTAAAWFRTESPTRQAIMWSFGVFAGNAQWYLRVEPENQRLLASLNNGTSGVRLQAPGNYADGEWHFVVLTRSADGVELYVDPQNETEWFAAGTAPQQATGLQSVGLRADVTYRHRIRAIGRAGASNWVETEEIQTPPGNEAPIAQVAVPFTDDRPRKSEGSLARLSHGRLMLVFNSNETTGDVSGGRISVIYSHDDGQSWSDEEILIDGHHQVLHPSLIRTQSGRLGLSYAILEEGAENAHRVFRYSDDDGATWSEEIALTDDQFAYTTGAHDRMLELSNGRLLISVHARIADEPAELATLIYTSDDAGETWVNQTLEPLKVSEGPGGITFGFWEGSVAELDDGELLLVGRTATGYLYESRSDDYGESWTTPKATELINPIAIPKIFTDDQGTVVVLRNPHADSGLSGSGRWMLAAQTSHDGGRTWGNYKQLEYIDDTQLFYSPAVLVEGDTAHVAYSHVRGSVGLTSGPSDLLHRTLDLHDFRDCQPATRPWCGPPSQLPAAWDATAIYTAGDQVNYGGAVYEGTWWSQGDVPGSSPWGPWQEITTDPDGTAIWTASRIFDTGEVVIHNGAYYTAMWWTRNQKPGDPRGPWRPKQG